MLNDGSPCRVSLVHEMSQPGHGVDDEDEAPVLEPEYGDLLDAQWLQRGSDALDPEDDLVDIGLTIDIADTGDLDEAQAMELDVGSLLTSLPSLELSDPAEPEREGAEASLALHDLLLPEEGRGGRGEDDDEVGNDASFPVFDGISAPRPAGSLDDDAEGPQED